jgi:hypothetical protein
MRNRRNASLDQPWLPIAAVIGVIAVVAIAAIFFLGGGGTSSSPSSSGASSPTGTSSVAPETTLLKNSGVSAITIKPTTTASVSATGTWVEVNYIGSFIGKYGTTGNMSVAQDSGDKVYQIETNGMISATFQKQDRSTTHDLTVQIWKDGKAVKFAKNSSAFGIVTIDYTP